MTSTLDVTSDTSEYYMETDKTLITLLSVTFNKLRVKFTLECKMNRENSSLRNLGGKQVMGNPVVVPYSIIKNCSRHHRIYQESRDVTPQYY